jgi:flagellar biosynthesis protein FlhF
MRIKKYTAKSMKEALLQIKQELGENAIILKTNHVPGKLFSQGDIEVTAAMDEDISVAQQAFSPIRVSDTGVYKRPKPAPEMPRRQASAAPRTSSVTANKSDIHNRRKDPPIYQSPDLENHTGGVDKKYELLKADITELKQMLTSALHAADGPDVKGLSKESANLFKRLVAAEVEQSVALQFTDRVYNNTAADEKDPVKRFIAELDACFNRTATVRARRPKQPYTVMFVGPTGAGKTTTLAKLAAHYLLSRKKSVAVITADTYRIAAIEQIRTFTDIMGMNLEIIFSPGEATAALAACASHDMVFIDTAGRSQKSAEHMQDLRSLIDIVQPDEIQLVLSAGTKVSDLISTVGKYKTLGANRLLFTKLDETLKLGNVFTVGVQTKIPFSFFTFGQRVPDDIELAQPHRLVTRLFEGSTM